MSLLSRALLASCLLLAGCGTQGSRWDRAYTDVYDPDGVTPQVAAKSPVADSDTSVKIYPLDGAVVNTADAGSARSVLDNTTSGGYTVFDPSVTVYPLPGADAPAYIADYAVPPYGVVQQAPQPQAAQALRSRAPEMDAGEGLALAPLPEEALSQSLPPVRTVDVPGVDPYKRPPVPGLARKTVQTANQGAQSLGTLRIPQAQMAPVSDDVVISSKSAPEATIVDEAPAPRARAPRLTGADTDEAQPVITIPKKTVAKDTYIFQKPRPVSKIKG